MDVVSARYCSGYGQGCCSGSPGPVKEHMNSIKKAYAYVSDMHFSYRYMMDMHAVIFVHIRKAHAMLVPM